MNPTLIDPKMLGFWARCIRDAQHLSQEALAANASVDIRTVQRFEAGKTVNLTSRRALAKALGYDKPDVFDDPKFIEEVLKFFDGLKTMQQKNLDDQHPDHIRVKAQALASGAEVIRFADVVNAMSCDIHDGLSERAKEVAASFCDYVQELMDLDDFPASGRLGIAKELDDLLQGLREKDAHAYFATRDRKFRGPDWGDKPSWELTVGFLAIVPADQKLSELYVPRKSKFG
ncbi:helix-turn-helix transcriptional regulator [Bradyrhizobium manausense]|uniref:helix-turn-helix domain-containing protein n=1 Tax=Bradyrhizobium manausense TaxID=989370 RepID=UPI001BA6BFE8|nr:helix-turn-helix transcriptional regulator [Bradyrhizobium manausense]MBR1090804.1 helix-turn-helix transcriptional regulator [Bradyrhizobium manausense]